MSEYVTQIIIASQRSVNLTRKLLSFSRKESGESNTANLSEILLEQRNMLEKSITPAVLLEFNVAENLWKVQLEVGDFEDAILNLSINGMHAIGEHKHGVIRYSSNNEFLVAEDANALQLEEGEYVKVIVSDNGCGMNVETRQRIFEPFFTTKGVKGTGLGLSQVYSFIKRNNGSISVYSEEGRGTEFIMFFPRSYNQTPKKIPQNNAKASFVGSETILIVDDEPALTQLASEILSKQGYQVVVANSAKQALAIMENSPVDLIISDIIMPEMDGYEFASIVREKYPHVKIQMASGFTSESQLKGAPTATHTILAKPYRKHMLIKTVRDALDVNNSDGYTH